MLRLSHWFAVSRTKGSIEASPVAHLPPLWGRMPDPNFYRNLTIALLPQMTSPCQ